MKVIIFVAAYLAGTIFAESLRDSTRITNAQNAHTAQFPHMVAVRHSKTLQCGGALVGLQWVLTSAECLWHYQGSEAEYSVFIGGLSILSSSEPGRVEIYAESIHPHPKFRMEERDTLYYYNIGLIKLKGNAPVSAQIQVAVLPASGSVVPNGLSVILSGWGGTNSRVSPVLQYAALTTMDIGSCAAQVGGSHEFTTAQICTHAYPDSSACWNDHGGPLIQYVTGVGTVVVGVAAYTGCLDPSHPTIYTNPGFPEHRDWIKEITGL